MQQAPAMRIAVLYATREGHTHKIAEHIVDELRRRQLIAHPVHVSAKLVDLSGFDALILAASVHLGRHEREMVAFVKQQRALLERLPSAFLSVSLSEAGVEQPDAPPARRAEAVKDVAQMIDAFIAETGWRPRLVLPVAGALLYRQYNFLVRFMMKRIARRAGGPTDTTRDWELTDWVALDRFVGEFVSALPA